MSDLLLEADKQKLNYQLRVTEPLLSYINQRYINESFAVAVAIEFVNIMTSSSRCIGS